MLTYAQSPLAEMVEGREHFGFALKARQAIRIASHRGGQHLNRNLTFQIRVDGLVHLAHATDAYLRGDLVEPDSRAGSEGQSSEV